MSSEQEWLQIQRKRASILKLIRQGHEQQLTRMDDYEVYKLMQDVWPHTGRKQVITMLQDLSVIGYVAYKQGFDDEEERVMLHEIELTSAGTVLTIRRQNNEHVVFN